MKQLYDYIFEANGRLSGRNSIDDLVDSIKRYFQSSEFITEFVKYCEGKLDSFYIPENVVESSLPEWINSVDFRLICKGGNDYDDMIKSIGTDMFAGCFNNDDAVVKDGKITTDIIIHLYQIPAALKHRLSLPEAVAMLSGAGFWPQIEASIRHELMHAFDYCMWGHYNNFSKTISAYEIRHTLQKLDYTPWKECGKTPCLFMRILQKYVVNFYDTEYNAQKQEELNNADYVTGIFYNVTSTSSLNDIKTTLFRNVHNVKKNPVREFIHFRSIYDDILKDLNEFHMMMKQNKIRPEEYDQMNSFLALSNYTKTIFKKKDMASSESAVWKLIDMMTADVQKKTIEFIKDYINIYKDDFERLINRRR